MSFSLRNPWLFLFGLLAGKNGSINRTILPSLQSRRSGNTATAEVDEFVQIGSTVMSTTFVPKGNQNPSKPDKGNDTSTGKKGILLPDSNVGPPDFGGNK